MSFLSRLDLRLNDGKMSKVILLVWGTWRKPVQYKMKMELRRDIEYKLGMMKSNQMRKILSKTLPSQGVADAD
uniref:Uncharacterized protein n=1 Tax=viral metagenome TaxID=1070528 RepID=A0A6M3JHH2_9ZZZZ